MEYYSPGKILLTGEYLVLDGAKALALPVKYGQTLRVLNALSNNFSWKSLDQNKHKWFFADFSPDLSIDNTSDYDKAKILQKLLMFIRIEKPELFKTGLDFTTYLNFDKNWGLGTSSTLVNNLGQWAEINAFELLKLSFGGSGYDIAVAQEQKALIYQIKPKPNWKIVNFQPDFKDKLLFVFLNQKQNSRQEIKAYQMQKTNMETVKRISEISQKALLSKTIDEFSALMDEHESILSKVLNRPTVKEIYFSDFQGSIKSLGAWGGDFVLATKNDAEYFKTKGFNTVFEFDKFIQK